MKSGLRNQFPTGDGAAVPRVDFSQPGERKGEVLYPEKFFSFSSFHTGGLCSLLTFVRTAERGPDGP